MKGWIHLCIDMQRMFAEDTPWHVPWMRDVSPAVSALAGRHPERTIFTRFVPPIRSMDMQGMWQSYYQKWWMMTGEHLPREMIEIVEPLKQLTPPARTFDKVTYSPWVTGGLHRQLAREGVETIVLTGGETDVCVMATALGALDLGYRVILLGDAVCSGVDSTHDAGLKLLGERFSVQVEITSTEELLSRI